MKVGSLERAHEFASKVDLAEVWIELGHAQLGQSLPSDAIASYLRAQDSSKYAEVIEAAKKVEVFADLVKYLLMVRKKVKDPKVSIMWGPVCLLHLTWWHAESGAVAEVITVGHFCLAGRYGAHLRVCSYWSAWCPGGAHQHYPYCQLAECRRPLL